MKEWKAAEKETQRMTQSGAVTVNQVTGEITPNSDRPAEQDFSASSDAGRLTGDLVQRAQIHRDSKKAKQKRLYRRNVFREGASAAERPSSRLQFTKEELAAPELQKAIRKSDKAADKLDAARAAVPDKAPVLPKSKTILTRPIQEAGAAVHSKIREVEQDNSGVQAGHLAERTLERGVSYGSRRVQSLRAEHTLKPWKDAAKAEQSSLSANAEFHYQKTVLENPKVASSNPISRMWQKRKLRQQYAAYRSGQNPAQAAQTAKKTAENTAKATKKAAEEAKKAASFVVKHWKGCLIAGGLILISAFMLGGFSSCMSLFGTGVSNVAASSYLSEDNDLTSAEAAYSAKEAELQAYLDTYKATHDYDEYHFDLDEIGHDPYVLLSILSALHEGVFTMDQIQGDLDMLFEKQYILAETVTTETRYRTETDTWVDAEGNTHTDTYRVPYTYYICIVSLENFNLSHVPVYMMSEEQLSLYAGYMSGVGNKPELYPDSEYISRYITNPPAGYEIPAERLTDERFATLIEEAEKYLGYPYVWGGSNPSTSFDCSGFVSWVLTNSGLCNTGRLGAQGLYNISTPVSSANAEPGDLVFFVGTYDTDGISHVGFYVGDGKFLHCGDPIQYADLNTSYWQAHFYAYGRPPYD